MDAGAKDRMTEEREWLLENGDELVLAFTLFRNAPEGLSAPQRVEHALKHFPVEKRAKLRVWLLKWHMEQLLLSGTGLVI